MKHCSSRGRKKPKRQLAVSSKDAVVKSQCHRRQRVFERKLRRLFAKARA